MAPAHPLAFKKQAMTQVKVPVYIVISGKDELLKGYDKRYLEMFAEKPKSLEFPEAGHFVYLMDCPPLVKSSAPIPCSDIGTDRVFIHPRVQRESLEFFKKHLK